jgi:hypothetical protein
MNSWLERSIEMRSQQPIAASAKSHAGRKLDHEKKNAAGNRQAHQAKKLAE